MGNRDRLLYFFDPLCGWCWGFSDVMQAFVRNHPELLFQPVCGGMMTGYREGPVGSFSKHILEAIPRLENLTGARFGTTFKDKILSGDMYFSSVKPSLALCVLRNHFPAQIPGYIHTLMSLHFTEGYSLQEDDVYRILAEEANMPPETLALEMESEEVKYQFRQDTDFTANCGIDGFPCMVVQLQDKMYMLNQGYNSLESLENALTWAKNEAGIG
ncbi:MAG: DsbA family protein [Bacteroidetes bacterium]|nr:DsbA family protein [Bacteroidota bacterium]